MNDELKGSFYLTPNYKKELLKKRSPKRKSLRFLGEIAATYSTKVMEYFEKFLDVSLEKLYDGINFNYPKGMDFQNL